MNKMLDNAINVARILITNKYEAYFVGGCVRDSIMNLPPHDIDITTNALPSDVQRIFPMHINTGLAHGTVSVKPIKESEFYEVTTYRIDGKYDDGRHPDKVIFTPSLEEDLARRDFTINAIAKNPLTNEFVDPFNGRDDIANKTIRCVGDAKSRFMEDPLRVLRAMRFAIKLGFTIEDNTKAAMHDSEVLAKLDECISKERITEELRKMLTCGNPIREIFTEFSDIVGVIIPEMIPCINAPHNSRWHKHDIYEHILYVTDGCETNKFEIKLAALLHDIGKPASRTHDEDGIRDHFYGHPAVSHDMSVEVIKNDLRLSNEEKHRVLTLVLHHDDDIVANNKSVRRFVINTNESIVRDWLILKKADMEDHKCATGEEEKWNAKWNNFNALESVLDNVMEEETAFKITDLAINGNDLINILQIKPGPTIGIILRDLFDAVVDERIANTRDELLNFARSLDIR